jgi:hypothetical protein
MNRPFEVLSCKGLGSVAVFLKPAGDLGGKTETAGTAPGPPGGAVDALARSGSGGGEAGYDGAIWGRVGAAGECA